MAKGKSGKRNKGKKGARRDRISDSDESMGLNEALCTIKQDGIKIEAICSLGEVQACIAQLREALALPTAEPGAAAVAAGSE